MSVTASVFSSGNIVNPIYSAYLERYLLKLFDYREVAPGVQYLGEVYDFT